MSCRSDDSSHRGRKPTLTGDMLATIARRIQAGETALSLAREYGCSTAGLSRALRREGYETTRQQTAQETDARNELTRLLRAGYTITGAATQAGITYDHARWLLKSGKLGITRDEAAAIRGRKAPLRRKRAKKPEAKAPEACAGETPASDPEQRKRRGRTAITQNQMIAAANLLRTGSTLDWAARNVVVTPNGLRRALRRAGYDTNKLIRHGTPKSRYSPERAKTIEKMVREGRTLTAIATDMGIALSTLCAWSEKGLVDTKTGRRRNRMLTDEQYRAIYARYAADPAATTGELARIYCVSEPALRKNWRRMGLQLDEKRWRAQQSASLAAAHRAKQPSDEQLRAAWVKYKNSYIRSEKIAREMRMSWASLKKRWRELGYDVNRLTRLKQAGRTGRGM